MPELVKIARYTYHLFSSREDDNPLVFLYDEASDVVGQLRFVPDTDPLPEAERVDGKFVLYFRRSGFAEVLDMLRNEGPIYVNWKDGTNTRLSTEYEPVGEGELVRR